MTRETETIYVVVYEHKHGSDIFARRSRTEAENLRNELAADWWDEEMPEGEPKPEDPYELADIYFDEMSSRGECCYIESVLLPGDCEPDQA